MLAEVNQTLAKKDIDLVVSQAAKDYITEEGYDEVMGVRPASSRGWTKKFVIKWQTSIWII